MAHVAPTRSMSWLARLRAEGWTPLLQHVWLLPILLMAAWLRFAGLSNEHLYGDEAEYSIVARYLSRDPTYLAYPMLEGMGPTPFVSQPPLLLYLMAISMKIFGATDFAAILPTAILGVATVAVVYMLGNRLGGRMMALAAAALVAVMPFHVELSRRAMLDVGYVFFLMLTLYYLVAWVQTRSRRHATWAGVAAGATALSKLPGVLAVAIALIVFIAVLVRDSIRASTGKIDKARVKETVIQGGFGALPVAIAAFLYVALLWYLEALGNLWMKLTWQLGRVDTSQAQSVELAQQVRDWTFYFTDAEFSFAALMGGAVVIALGVIGLVAMAARAFVVPRARIAHLVVPIAVVVIVSFFLWSDRKEGFYLLPFAPMLALLIGSVAVGVRDLVRWGGIRFSGATTSRVAPLALALGIVVVAVPAYGAATESVEDFALGESQEKFFGYGTREAAWWIQENDPEAGQYGTLLGRFTLLWYNEQPTYHWYMDHTLVENRIRDGELKYIVYDEYLQLEFDESFMKQMITKYNGQQVHEFRDGPGGWAFVKVFKLNP